ncbi:MAG: bifunctional DNA-formamidopyrimidine glycosylase/DNA-(apurinic or apyrimidinic site) lyase [Pseudomonadota bacterium]|nr:bifunctional DNA-formamidopyrimidine glycosylase/DNA-(apurinic or apyrimidinic site) lyase [Pseudomonadota bacterium]
MPELPEVETVRRGLAPIMEGFAIERIEVRRNDLRVAVSDDFAPSLEGRTLKKLGRRAKYLVGEFDNGTILLAHLGMSGRILIDIDRGYNQTAELSNSAYLTKKHEHIVFYLENGATVGFYDPRRFGLMVLTDQAGFKNHQLIRDLGPEPINHDFTGAVLASALRRKKTSIKAALLDQRVVAGIGNIYACEALFLAGISPRRIASNVQGKRANKLAKSIRDVLLKAIDAGGSSINDHVSPSGDLGYFQHFFSVYGREGHPCPKSDCGRSIASIRQSGRSTFYCPNCQR